jgi:hypothetical protein
MSTTQLLKPFVRPIYYRALRLENAIGYRITFSKLPSGWVNGQITYDMSRVWSKHHIPARGVNYFTLGSIHNGVSSRFDPESPYFQAWLGGYIVQFSAKRDWTPQEHFNLGIADQHNWLLLYGDPKPVVELRSNDFKDLGKISVDGFKGRLYEGGGLSHTDFGSGNRSVLLKLIAIGAANLFNFSNPHLDLQGDNLIPRWNDGSIVPSYHTVQLKGYVAILDLNGTATAVFYANGTIFTDKSGIHHNTFEQIKHELMQCITDCRIERL